MKFVTATAKWLTLLAFVAGGWGCSKHDCELEGAQEKYWKDIANTTEGAEKCLVSVNPYGCDLDEGRCTPTLNAVHGDGSQEAVEKRYRSALEKQGWEFVGEKVEEDESKAVAFKKGDDELLVSFGTSTLSNAIAGDKGIDVFMMRKPENATGSIVDKYAKKE